MSMVDINISGFKSDKKIKNILEGSKWFEEYIQQIITAKRRKDN